MENKIEKIKQRLDCISFLRSRGFEISVGKNIKCPLGIHDEKNPSFGVFEGGKKFKCFSCDSKGDVIDLAEKFGQSMDDLFFSIGGKRNEYSKKWEEKKQSPQSKETIEKFLAERGVEHSLVSFLVSEEQGQICVPIIDKEEEICGIQKRSLSGHVFRIEGGSGFFYSPKEKQEELILVEGMTDFLTVRQYFPNVLGFVSASSFDGAEKILSQYRKIIWLGDNDTAGEKLKKKIYEKCKKQTIFELSLGSEKDISDVWRKFPKDLRNKETMQELMDFKEMVYSPIKSHTVDSYTWGLDEIDKKIKTIKKGTLAVFVADSNAGKSTFCFWMARKNKEKYNHKVVYFSLESTKEEMYHNIALSHAGVTKIEERDNEHNKDEVYLKKLKSLDDEGRINIVGRSIDDGMTIEEIEKTVYSMEKCDLLIIDNLLSIQLKETRLSENQQVSQILQRLIGMARDCNIPIIIVHHYKKSLYKKKDEWENLSEMYGAKQVEIFAPLIIQARRAEGGELLKELSQFYLKEGKVRGGGSREEVCIFHDRGEFFKSYENG